MKMKVLGTVALLAMAALLVFVLHTQAAPTTAKAAPAVTAASAPEPHPQIREAIASLRRAKEHMEHAAHDFGGHRVEALRATDEAIRQLEICLKYDKD
jgi:hypothetical protein